MAAAAQVITTEYTLQQFVERHYITDGQHVGNVMIWGTRYDGSLYQIGYERADQLNQKIMDLRLQGQHKDLYLSANAFSGCKRSLEQLFAYHNIVIDIDGHLDGSDRAAVARRDHQIDAMAYMIQEDLAADPEILTPNTINRTGRGLQLWWSLEPLAASNKEKVDQIRGKLMEQIEKLLEDAGEALDLMSMDRGASNNDAGLFRMPGSYNRKTRTFGSFEEISDEPIDAFEEYNGQKRKPKASRPAIHSARVISLQKDVKAFLGLARVRQSALENLVAMRMEQGSITGSRDEFIFQSYATWANVYEDHDSIMEKVDRINGLFDQPLTQRELDRYLSSSRKKRYRITNKTMIERLAITEQEQEALGLHPGGSGKNSIREQLRQEARDKKRDRDQKILSLREAGARQQDIADQTGCSLRTVKNVIQAAGARRSDQILGSIAQGLAEGMTAKEIAKDAGCALQTVYNHMHRQQESPAEEPRQEAPESPEKGQAAAGAQNVDQQQATGQEGQEAGGSTPETREETAGSSKVIPFQGHENSHSKKCKKRPIYLFRYNSGEVPGGNTRERELDPGSRITSRGGPPD